MIGSGLFTMLALETNLGTWVAYFLVVAIGTGISINHPYTAVQTVLEESTVPIGNGNCFPNLPPAYSNFL